ncbi:MAG: phage major tail tube protein, partial [Sporomusa sp.]
LQVQDGGTGVIVQKGYQVALRVFPKSPDFGKLEVGKPTGDGLEMETLYMKVAYDGSEIMMIDKPNFIYRVDGVDYLKGVRDLI